MLQAGQIGQGRPDKHRALCTRLQSCLTGRPECPVTISQAGPASDRACVNKDGPPFPRLTFEPETCHKRCMQARLAKNAQFATRPSEPGCPDA